MLRAFQIDPRGNGFAGPSGEVGVVNTVDVAGPILPPVIRTLSCGWRVR